MSSVTVDFPAPVEEVYAYLAHPVNRPRWQSSLRRIDESFWEKYRKIKSGQTLAVAECFGG